MTEIPRQPGVHEQLLPPSGRRYAISIPEKYDGSQPTPLVVALHWGGPVAPYTGKWLLLGLVEPALRELDALLVAPDRTLEDWANPQSETETLELLDFIKQHYNIDARRVLLTGYSLGGIGTWYMAARNQDLFAAALVVSATPLPETSGIDWRIPLYVIHSRQDQIFPLEPLEETIQALKARDISIEFVTVDGITHFETERFVQPLRAAVPWITGVWS
jgi:predicted peptidase